MKPITLVAPFSASPQTESMLKAFARSDLVEEILLTVDQPGDRDLRQFGTPISGSLTSGKTISEIISRTKTPFLLLFRSSLTVRIDSRGIEKLISTAQASNAGIVYADFYEELRDRRIYHPLNDYQFGSVRDDFDFGPLLLLSRRAINRALGKHGEIPDVRFAAIYDLRLKISIDSPIYRISKPVYTLITHTEKPSMQNLFAYLDPANRPKQKEMEAVFTDHLRRIGAYIPPDRLKKPDMPASTFPVEASVVIPVKNRRDTIRDSVNSALTQITNFPFNVIVIDNHSTDGTTDLLLDLAAKDPRLRIVIPEATDLGIGGCWNEALDQDFCGRYAVQLDSDDLYSSPHSLQVLVDLLRTGKYAMVIGSYTVVNSSLEQIPPGLVDHREWTDENGHNNALRINGLGAPRAFLTPLMRRIRFLNVSYGEDYAAALRISRQYKIGRIFESLYLCRRWSGNTDERLGVEEENRNNAFKDKVRSNEIIARQRMLASEDGTRS